MHGPHGSAPSHFTFRFLQQSHALRSGFGPDEFPSSILVGAGASEPFCVSTTISLARSPPARDHETIADCSSKVVGFFVDEVVVGYVDCAQLSISLTPVEDAVEY